MGRRKKQQQVQLLYLSFPLFSPSVVDPGSLLFVGSDLSLAKLRTGVSVRSAELIVHLLEVNSQSFFEKKKEIFMKSSKRNLQFRSGKKK